MSKKKKKGLTDNFFSFLLISFSHLLEGQNLQYPKRNEI